jgi:hypothetical protein
MADKERDGTYAELMRKLNILQDTAMEAFKSGDLEAEAALDTEIGDIKQLLDTVRPRANRKLGDEDWEKIEHGGPPPTSPMAWGGFWTMLKSDRGPQRYRFACSWAKSFENAKRLCMQGGPWPDVYFLLYRNEDTRGRHPGPYTLWSEYKKSKYFYIFGMIDGADGKFFRFPRLIDLYRAKDYALMTLERGHGR